MTRTFSGSTNHEFLLRQYLFNVSRYSPEVVPRVNINDNIFIYIKWSLIRLKGLVSDINIRLKIIDTIGTIYLDVDQNQYFVNKDFPISFLIYKGE